jgi:hypothetical protein
VTINEGETLDVPITVSDPDTDQALTLSLFGSAPPGVVLNAATRHLTWPTGEGNGPSTNMLTVVVRDNDFESLSATSRVTVVVNEVNSPPTLAVIPNRVVNEKALLSFTASASDPDLPLQSLTYSLGPGAPFGATIHPTSGVFSWTPSETNGGRTNIIFVIASDSGTPSLSATQNFRVAVRDVLPDFVLGIGSTNLLAGQSSHVPVLLQSGLDLASVNLQLSMPPAGLVNLTFQPATPEVGSAVLSPDGTNGARLIVTAAGGRTLQGDLTLARLFFDTAPAVHSFIVPLPVSGLNGTLSSGATLGKGRGTGGRVFVIGQEPLLDAQLSSNAIKSLVLYGHQGEAYELQSTTNLNAPLVWQPVHEIELTGTFDTWTGLPTATPQVFYRAVQLPSPSVNRIGGVTRLEDGRLQFQFTGMAGRNYVIEASTDLLNWQAIGTNAAPISFTTPLGFTAPYRFFRTKNAP